MWKVLDQAEIESSDLHSDVSPIMSTSPPSAPTLSPVHSPRDRPQSPPKARTVPITSITAASVAASSGTGGPGSPPSPSSKPTIVYRKFDDTEPDEQQRASRVTSPPGSQSDGDRRRRILTTDVLVTIKHTTDRLVSELTGLTEMITNPRGFSSTPLEAHESQRPPAATVDESSRYRSVVVPMKVPNKPPPRPPKPPEIASPVLAGSSSPRTTSTDAPTETPTMPWSHASVTALSGLSSTTSTSTTSTTSTTSPPKASATQSPPSEQAHSPTQATSPSQPHSPPLSPAPLAPLATESPPLLPMDALPPAAVEPQLSPPTQAPTRTTQAALDLAPLDELLKDCELYSSASSELAVMPAFSSAEEIETQLIEVVESLNLGIVSPRSAARTESTTATTAIVTTPMATDDTSTATSGVSAARASLTSSAPEVSRVTNDDEADADFLPVVPPNRPTKRSTLAEIRRIQRQQRMLHQSQRQTNRPSTAIGISATQAEEPREHDNELSSSPTTTSSGGTSPSSASE